MDLKKGFASGFYSISDQSKMRDAFSNHIKIDYCCWKGWYHFSYISKNLKNIQHKTTQHNLNPQHYN